MPCLNESSNTMTANIVATATATATAALNLLQLYFPEDNRPTKRRRMAGRPKKHIYPEDAVAAKLASNRTTYHRRKQGPSSQGNTFVMYEPTQHDAPPLTNNATGIRCDINTLPTEENNSYPVITQQAIIVSRGCLEVPLPLLPIPLSHQPEEQDVKDSINQLNLHDEIDLEYEAAITLQSLQLLPSRVENEQGK